MATALSLLLGSMHPTAHATRTIDPAVEGFLFDAFVPLSDEAIEAIEDIQEWLVETQRPDGSWTTPYGNNNAGVIGYALLALMVSGDVPGEGKNARAIGLATQFLMNSQREIGLIMGADDSQAPMYQHGIATLALAEVYGMTQNPRIREVLINAVNLTVDTQGPNGGWRYQPRRDDGDTSATVMQIMALRAAIEAGIHVPEQTIARAEAFIRACFIRDSGGFGYQDRKAPEPGRSAASLVSLQSLGHHNDPIIPKTVEYLMNTIMNRSNLNHMWYTHYYASVGLYHFGGEQWQTYYAFIKEHILSQEMTSFLDPSAPARRRTGGSRARRLHRERLERRVLDAAWVAMVLGVPYRYLPIYQR